MAKIGKTLSDYRALAHSRGVVYLGSEIPANTKLPARWRCDRCGRRLTKSYFSLQQGEFACRCRNQSSLREIDYHTVAQRLGIRWEPDEDDYFPPNSKWPTTWRLPDGKIIEASYKELAYTVPKRLKDLIDAAQAETQ